jgi:hypothetical protein
MRLALIGFIALTGCGGVFVAFVSNPGGTMSVVGTVTIVNVGFVADGHGSSAMVTVVTLINVGTANTVNLCGDQRSHFPMNQFVRVQFTSGIPCSGFVAVVIVSG